MSARGFWRRIRLTPAPGVIQADVEDDFHCMSVVLHHAQGTATEIVADLQRAPWSTCPGAPAELVKTFKGQALSEFPAVGQKHTHCTHLYDLALLAARHAGDDAPTIYDIQVSDPENEHRHAEIKRNQQSLLRWIESGFHIVEPKGAAGIRLDKLRVWIDTLEPELHEPARLLQWGNMLANGRIIPLEKQSDATKMPASCYTFQPERAVVATRIGLIRDFSQGDGSPLDEVSVSVSTTTTIEF
ncbi:MAG: hypothetical protein VYA55_14435 [Pseudomonadota bacterium]|nr:hypothetical protein [Pseudomonadota bacterium]